MKKADLHELLASQLGPLCRPQSDYSSVPFSFELRRQDSVICRAYAWTITRQLGGRPQDEYKMQVILPGHKPKTRVRLDFGGGQFPLLIGYSPDFACWAFWDATSYADFTYSRNLQIREHTLSSTFVETVARQTRIVRQHGDRIVETILACQPAHLATAIEERILLAGGSAT